MAVGTLGAVLQCLWTSLRSWLHQEDWIRPMGREPFIMQNKELLPRDLAVPPSIFTPTFFHIRIYPNHLVCTTSHLLAENFQRGEENPPSLNKNKNHLCERKTTSSETLGSNYGKPRATVQAFSDGGGWGRWFISRISSTVNSTIPFHFIFSPLLTRRC